MILTLISNSQATIERPSPFSSYEKLELVRVSALSLAKPETEDYGRLARVRLRVGTVIIMSSNDSTV